jgi:predicted Zn-dependent peptidase
MGEAGWVTIRAMLNTGFRHTSIAIALSLVATAVCLSVPAASFAGDDVPSGVVERDLPGGGKALLWPRPGSGTVLITVAVPAGSQDEPGGMGGLSHYLEHLLFDGFDDLDERGVTEAFERLSAYMNAFTREQATVYFALVPRFDAVAAAELMTGMLTRSTIGPQVYEKEKKVILEELAKDHASPDGLKEERLRAVMWSGTPLEHPVGGSVESVGATTREEVVRYWQKHYPPSGYRILITGDLGLDGLASVLKPFEDLKSSEGVPPGRPDQLSWPGWGEWGASEAPKSPSGSDQMPSMGMGRGMHSMSKGPDGGTLAVVVAVPDVLAESSTSLEILTRWLGDASGTLSSELVPALAREITVSRLPREPRDLIEFRIKAEVGMDPQEILARLLGALAASVGGPSDAEVSAIQRAWRGERALNDQRLHYAAVFYGEALSSGRGDLAESVAPSVVDAEEVRMASAQLLTDVAARTRAAWIGTGGPDDRVSLPKPIVPAERETAAVLEAGPLGSVTATLDNGIVVGILPEEGSEVFGLHLLVADRSLREPADAPGVADLVHRLLPGGTRIAGSRDLASRIEWAGLDVKTADSPMIPFDNRYHVPDFSYVRIEGPARNMVVALTMLAEMVRAPEWDEDGRRAASSGHVSARKADNRGSEKARQLFLAALLGEDHPLARPVSGPQGEVEAGAEQVRAFVQDWPAGYFAPDRLIVTLASPLPAEETLGLVNDAFSGGPAKEPARGPYPAPRPAAEGPAIEVGEAPQVTVLWGRIAEVEAEDRAPLLVAMDGLSDRMTAVIREREGLAYRLGAGVRALPDGAWILSASVGTRPENSDRVAELLAELVDQLSDHALSAGDLERLNARARRTRMLRGLSAASRAYRVGRALFEGPGSPLAVDDAAYASVTPEQIQRVVRTYLVADEMLLVVTP